LEIDLTPTELDDRGATLRHTANTGVASDDLMVEQPLSAGYDNATRNDAEFNRDFRHGFTTVNDVQMHYVIGGEGPETVVLLHGWPESWYQYRGILHGLLRPDRTVIAVDLPGMGDSTGELPDYKKTTMAGYIHQLLAALGLWRNVHLVGHDFGMGVAYALAAQYREGVRSLMIMEFPLVGKNLSFAEILPLRWHFYFNRRDPLAEQLVQGREREFLSYFYPCESPLEAPIPQNSINEYVRVFSRLQVLHAGFELYRTWEADELDNIRFQRDPLAIPVRMLLRSELYNLLFPPVQDAAPQATGRSLEGAGHWLPEEHPQLLLDEINEFVAINGIAAETNDSEAGR
jgi:pimeloyl-ACP methyl ester carboxylesterase